MKESDIQASVRLALNPYAIIFRVNSGKVRMQDGRYFDTGVPNGHFDLAGFRRSDGKAIYIEVKTDKGKLRESQKKFLSIVGEYDVIIGVCRSSQEAIDLVLGK